MRGRDYNLLAVTSSIVLDIRKAMLKLEELKKHAAVSGIDPAAPVRIVSTESIGDDALAAFALHLKDMSHDDHQWAIVPIPGIFYSSSGEPRSFALLGYSNPSLGLLNALCFVVPLVALGGDGRSEPELIVSFSPRSITPLTRGLYIEEGLLSMTSSKIGSASGIRSRGSCGLRPTITAYQLRTCGGSRTKRRGIKT